MTDSAGVSPPATAWSWGDYLLVPAQRRLLRGGVAVEVEDRALDLIVLLLQHRERALDRQEVITAIWDKRPVSDATLRQLVYKARRAVGDDGERQAVISTLYGRSLQWIAPVEMVFETDDATPAAPMVPAAQPATKAKEPLPPPVPVRGPRWRIAASAALAIVIVLGVAAGGWWFVSARHAAPAEAASLLRLAITPIENATGDASLDWVGNGLPGLLGGLLEQGGGINVVDAARVAKVWKYKPTAGRTPVQQLRFVTDASVVVSGRLRQLATQLYELDLRVQQGDDPVADIVVSGDRPGQVAVDAVRRVRAQLALAAPKQTAAAQLPRDPFLAEAFARGLDLQARGKLPDAVNYFGLCVAQAPAFLPCRYHLGVAQLGMGDSKAGDQTLQALLPLATSEGVPRLAARALLMLANHARIASSSATALDDLRQALPFARQSGDMETLAQVQLMTAITAHSAHDLKLSAQSLAAAEELLRRNPGMRYAREMLYEARFSIAGDGANPEDAIAPARASLAMAVEDGNESFAVTALDNLAVALRDAQHTGEAITVNARALQRAHAGGFEADESLAAGNLALGLISAGLPKAAVGFGAQQYTLAGEQHDVQTQAIALLINMTADLQLLDGASALARLKRGDALAWDSFDPEIVLDRWLYEGMAAYLADPAALPAMQQRVDAYRAGHKLVPGLLNRVHVVHALAAAAKGREGDADAALKAAVAVGHLDDDGDMELRMAPLLIALHGHDAAAAAIALKGYDPVHTRDAAILRAYAEWMRQTGDVAAAERAEARLAQLRKVGTDALAAAGIDVAKLDGTTLGTGSHDAK